MEDVSDEEIEQLEKELRMLEDTSMGKKGFFYESAKTQIETNKGIQKSKNIEQAYLKAIVAILLKKDIDYLDKLYRKLRGK